MPIVYADDEGAQGTAFYVCDVCEETACCPTEGICDLCKKDFLPSATPWHIGTNKPKGFVDFYGVFALKGKEVLSGLLTINKNEAGLHEKNLLEKYNNTGFVVCLQRHSVFLYPVDEKRYQILDKRFGFGDRGWGAIYNHDTGEMSGGILYGDKLAMYKIWFSEIAKGDFSNWRLGISKMSRYNPEQPQRSLTETRELVEPYYDYTSYALKINK